jgi:hypothetical protein
VEAAEEEVLDRATAARTIAELEAEIRTLQRLEGQARALRQSGTDTKWRELNTILDHPLMTDPKGNRRKLIVFTEPRDTLEYLAGKIRTRLGRHEAVVVIHGGVTREDRRKAIEAFTHDKGALAMIANDAAGEGVNLQRAHLMINYDLPWNPNRLEQRFGRIHRIGQTEICHLWNLVAADTREGEVYARLLQKLETARAALGGRVYDVLGQVFSPPSCATSWSRPSVTAPRDQGASVREGRRGGGPAPPPGAARGEGPRPQPPRRRAGRPTGSQAQPPGTPPNGGFVSPDPARPAPMRRYFATVTLDPDRAPRDMGKIAEEVLQHLTTLPGGKVTLTLEIAADLPDDVPEDTQRIVRENGTSLKFRSQGFEH